MKIYTIGHSNRSKKKFLKLLKKYGIVTIVDVRRFPTSRMDIFKKENMKKWLLAGGVEYLHLEELGGYRGGYEKWMKNKKWKESYKILKEVASRKETAIMCAEKLPFRCHRRFIAMRLKSEGWRVIHIIDENRIWEEKRKG